MRASEIVRSLLAGLIILVAGVTASAGQSAGAKATPCDGSNVTGPMFSQVGTSEAAVKAFLGALQKAVASDDRRKVASIIRYPIYAWARDRDIRFKTPASLVASYELVFTAALKKTIAEARTECLFTNWKGVMIHDGEIWINALPRVLKIIRINRPVGGQQQVKPARSAFKVHPKAFSLIECWETDSECPVVTEINLDAVAANSNQFSPKDIKEEGEWITCPSENGRGFTRYRTMETAGNRYTVEYQDNGGGTLTMSAAIEFIVDKRVLRKDGKPKSVRVLRVLAFRVM